MCASFLLLALIEINAYFMMNVGKKYLLSDIKTRESDFWGGVAMVIHFFAGGAEKAGKRLELKQKLCV